MAARLVGVEVGTAKVPVTPQKPVYLAGLGHGRLSVGVHDELFARALVVCEGSKVVALVGVDSIGVMRDHLLPLKEKLAARGVLLLLGSTHDHSSPDTIGLWGPEPGVSGFDEEYMELLLSGVEEAVEKALEEAGRGVLELGSAALPQGVAKNTRNPDLLDREIPFIIARSRGRAVATLVNFGLHPEVLWRDNRLMTADFVHYLCRELEEAVGGVAVFLNGALGGMVTPDVADRTFEEAERVGVTLARAVLERISRAKARVEASCELAFASKPVELPVHNALLAEAARAGIVKRRVGDPPTVETEVSVLELRPFASVAALPGEPLPAVGLRVKGMLGRPYRFLVSLCNDEIGYIIDRDDRDPRRYEESMSLGPLTCELLLSALSELLQLLQRL